MPETVLQGGVPAEEHVARSLVSTGTDYFSVYGVLLPPLDPGRGVNLTMPQWFLPHDGRFSPDGNAMDVSAQAGIDNLDISSVQQRDPYPVVPQLSTHRSTDGSFHQHSVPVTYDGTRCIFTPGEAGSGGVEVIDVSDPSLPQVQTRDNLPHNIDSNFRSASGGSVSTTKRTSARSIGRTTRPHLPVRGSSQSVPGIGPEHHPRDRV